MARFLSLLALVSAATVMAAPIPQSRGFADILNSVECSAVTKDLAAGLGAVKGFLAGSSNAQLAELGSILDKASTVANGVTSLCPAAAAASSTDAAAASTDAAAADDSADAADVAGRDLGSILKGVECSAVTKDLAAGLSAVKGFLGSSTSGNAQLAELGSILDKASTVASGITSLCPASATADAATAAATDAAADDASADDAEAATATVAARQAAATSESIGDKIKDGAKNVLGGIEGALGNGIGGKIIDGVKGLGSLFGGGAADAAAGAAEGALGEAGADAAGAGIAGILGDVAEVGAVALL